VLTTAQTQAWPAHKLECKTLQRSGAAARPAPGPALPLSPADEILAVLHSALSRSPQVAD
jgi:hypothetical protein